MENEAIELIKRKYPSLCHNCVNARKPASDENRDIGYVGCVQYTRVENYHFIGECEELGEGWVDLRASIFGKGTGIITNLQLLTLKVKSCKAFVHKND